MGVLREAFITTGALFTVALGITLVIIGFTINNFVVLLIAMGMVGFTGTVSFICFYDLHKALEKEDYTFYAASKKRKK